MGHRAVFFDLGGTLLRYGDVREPFDRLLVDIAARHGVDAPRGELRSLYGAVMREVFARFHPRPFYLHRELFREARGAWLAALGADPQRGDPDELYEGQMAVGLSAAAPRHGAEATLRALRERGLHLAVVSNIDDDQFEPLWRRLGLAGWFDATFTSEAVRCCKPHPEIFARALAGAGVPPDEAVFVGDSPIHDVVGARAQGIASVLIAGSRRAAGSGSGPPGADAPDHVIRELPELLEIVRP